MENLQSIFKDFFKYKHNESVKHRGDNKGNMSSDMGLLILHRELIESVHDDGSVLYEKHYYCRVIRFSGSGDIMRFKENELMSIQEYNQKQIEDEFERDYIREQMKNLKESIYKYFGVTRQSILKLKSDPDKEFAVIGFETNKETGKYQLRICQKNSGLEGNKHNVFIQSPDEIEIILNN